MNDNDELLNFPVNDQNPEPEKETKQEREPFREGQLYNINGTVFRLRKITSKNGFIRDIILRPYRP